MHPRTEQFVNHIKKLGYDVYVARSGHYGFITDATEQRVLSFNVNDGTLGGNYGPPSRECGTGWQLRISISDLRTADNVRAALDAYPPDWCKGWKHLTNVKQYLAQWGASSYFTKA